MLFFILLFFVQTFNSLLSVMPYQTFSFWSVLLFHYTALSTNSLFLCLLLFRVQYWTPYTFRFLAGCTFFILSSSIHFFINSLVSHGFPATFLMNPVYVSAHPFRTPRIHPCFLLTVEIRVNISSRISLKTVVDSLSNLDDGVLVFSSFPSNRIRMAVSTTLSTSSTQLMLSDPEVNHLRFL